MAGVQALNRFAIPLGAAFVALQASIYDVKGGQRAVIFDRFSGVSPTAVQEGTHFLIPFVQRAINFDVRIRPHIISSTTGSKDLQQVSLSLRTLARPDVRQLPKIYSSLGTDYIERVMPSICNEVLKAVVASFDAQELITQVSATSPSRPVIVACTAILTLCASNHIRPPCSERLSPLGLGRTFCSELDSSASSWRMSLW